MEPKELEYYQKEMLNFEETTENLPDNKDYDVTNLEYWKGLMCSMFQRNSMESHFQKLKQEEREGFFKFGVNCLSRFVQANFTGPPFDAETNRFLNDLILLKEIDCIKNLTMNNEDVNVNMTFPCLLVAAQCIFRNCHVKPLLNLWWQWRAILMHQRILDELSPTLLAMAESLQKDMKELNLTGDLKAQFEIEQAQLYCEFRNVQKADIHIKSACEIMGIKYELLGKLGKRTKHQEKDIAQLTLEVSLDDNGIERTPVKDLLVQKIIKLNDEVQYDSIQFNNENKEMNLTNLEQKCLLLIAQHMIISKPQDDLFYEELKPFLDIILSQNNTWCVRACTLLLRCKFEAKHKRTVERSLSQCEEIVNSYKEMNPHVLNRIAGVYNTGLEPIWKVEEQFADLMSNLGLIKASLDIYMRLKLWEEVIVCYTILEMRHKAEEIIKQQLEIKPTVKLYCLLGDATDDVKCYEKAWEFSKRRSHRAQRHWGLYYFTQKKYLECIPHFEKSVSINPLQAQLWSLLGFAALETQNWQVAATAYRRYTNLEPDGFEAWNNLAQAYIKLGNKRNAHHALQNALRCNFDNWKVWENFLVVSTDIGNYTDAIRSYHKLLDLKEKYLNLDVLKVIVYSVCDESVNTEAEMKSSEALLKRTRELLGRITAIYPADGTMWELYAFVAPIPLLKIQRLQRAYRGFTQGSWTKDLNTCKHVLYICLKLGEAVLDDNIKPKDTIVNSVRLNINSALSAIKKINYTENPSLQQEVVNVLGRIIEKGNIST